MSVQKVLLVLVAAGIAATTVACSSEGRSPLAAPTGLTTPTADDSAAVAPLEPTADDSAAVAPLESLSSTRAIRVRCERRSGRSKASVDGNRLAAGRYRATIISGANSATSRLGTAVGGQVEFDFDSNPNDVASGATRISATFIQGGRLTGQIKNSAGAVILSSTVACEVR